MGWRLALAGMGAVTLACGGSDSGGSNPDLAVAKAPTASGDGQTGAAEALLTDSIRVLVTRDGTPEVGSTVTWATTVPGGSVSPTTSITDADGLAATTWTLGVVGGTEQASARVSGAGGSPVNFTATATGGSGARFGNTFFRSNHNNSSDPAVDTIAVGTTFKWWGTGGTHTVRSIGATNFTSSGTLSGSQTYSHLFDTPGTYQYDCSIHGSGMTGRIVVQ